MLIRLLICDGSVAAITAADDLSGLLVIVSQREAIIRHPRRPAILAWNNGYVSAVDTLLGVPLEIRSSFGSGLGQGGAPVSRFPHDALKALLEPVQSEEDDATVQRDGVREHWEDVHDNLLERVELVDVHRVESRLSIDAAGEEQSIDVAQIASAGGIDEYRGNEGAGDDPSICMSQLARRGDGRQPRVGGV